MQRDKNRYVEVSRIWRRSSRAAGVVALVIAVLSMRRDEDEDGLLELLRCDRTKR
jgi:hypothetical protein